MKLYFVLSQFPRSITRNEWKNIWRWKRTTEKDCRELERLYRERIKDETLPSMLKSDLINRLINPPLLVHERQEITWHENNSNL